jgi:predicted ArsR family transcriptional regulator
VIGDRGRQADRAGDRQRLQAEALADPTRFAAYQHIRRAQQPLSVAEITDAVGVHHTAVRAHLTKLRDAGLIAESRAAPTGRGRPKLLYTPAGKVDSNRDPYRELSSMLARVLRDDSTPRQVGAAAGRESALGRDPSATTDTIELIEDEARDLGFDPVLRGGARRPELMLRHCPFADVAADDPDSICSLHIGVAEGIAAVRGDVEVLGMLVHDPHRAGCRLQMRRIDHTEAPIQPTLQEDTR